MVAFLVSLQFQNRQGKQNVHRKCPSPLYMLLGKLAPLSVIYVLRSLFQRSTFAIFILLPHLNLRTSLKDWHSFYHSRLSGFFCVLTDAMTFTFLSVQKIISHNRNSRDKLLTTDNTKFRQSDPRIER